MTKAEQAISLTNRKECEYCESNNLPERTNSNDLAGKGTWVHYNEKSLSLVDSPTIDAQLCRASSEIEKAWAKLSESD
ncbi:MAG: hypothetical protein WBV94_31655 [Blastocatellia bacterium]